MPEPVRLAALAKTLRSKNAGVDLITFDIFFPDTGPTARRRKQGADPRVRGAAVPYGADGVVTFLELESLMAIKFTIRRERPSGSPGDSDVFGAQQYAPLLSVTIP